MYTQSSWELYLDCTRFQVQVNEFTRCSVRIDNDSALFTITFDYCALKSVQLTIPLCVSFPRMHRTSGFPEGGYTVYIGPEWISFHFQISVRLHPFRITQL